MKAFKGSIQKRCGNWRATYKHHGRRKYATFPTRALAVDWLVSLNRDLPTLTPAQASDALEALQILPEGVSLTDVAKAWQEAHPRQEDRAELRAEVLADIYIGARSHLRPRTVEGYRADLNRILAINSNFREWTRANLLAWTADMTPSKRNHIVASLRAFFAWCVEEGHTPTNPLDGVKAMKVDAPQRAVLTIEDTQRLLAAVRRTAPMTLHYFALCLFAGLRPDECLRLKPSNIAHGFIVVGEGIAKTHAARTIPIPANLAAFLEAHPLPREGTHGNITADRFRKRFTAVVAASGVKWSNDIMRHSYASYEYERSKDAGATPANLGHTSTTMLFKHYRGLVPAGSGNKYFSIEI